MINIKRIILEIETITDRRIPVIACYPEGEKNLPMVLVNHGTTSSSYDTLSMGIKLAERGLFALCIDAVWHGKRSDGKLSEYLEPKVYKKNYLSMLLQMADDMSAIIDYFGNDDRVDTKRVGMTGISQGGYVAFMTMTKDNRIKSAAPLIGSPDLEDKYGNSLDWDSIDIETQENVIKHSPLRNFEKMFPTALLIQSSIGDDIVPVTGTRRLDEKLKPLYKNCPEKYKYIEYENIKHEAPWEMQERAIDWLCKTL